MNYSILDANNVCLNTIVLPEDSDWQPPDDCTLVEQPLNIGCTYQYDEAESQWVEISRPRLPFDEQAKLMRQQRNQLLADSDWTQLSDAPVDAEVWTTYRQQLRDITNQEGFPWEVVWPVSP